MNYVKEKVNKTMYCVQFHLLPSVIKQSEGQGAVLADPLFSICVLSLHQSPSVSFKV